MMVLSSCSLFEKKIAIVDDGAACFSVVMSRRASEEVMAQVEAFAALVEEKTGVNLLGAEVPDGAPRILIGDTGEEASEAVEENLNATVFYVGFSGSDLVIHALNDAMLVQAITYLCDTYISSEDADVKQGRLRLPAKLNYTAPPLTCTAEDFTIVRAGTMSDRGLAAIASLRSSILSATGVDLRIKTDLTTTDAEAKEILVGTPSREQTTPILESLAFDQYFIGTVGNKIMILAKNDVLLEIAIQKFVSSFLTSTDAVISKEDKTFAMPAVLSNYGGESCFLLADGGKSNAVLIYPDGLGDIATEAITLFCENYKRLTGCELPAYKDTEKPADNTKFEILLGQTNRNQSSAAMSSLQAGKWSAALTGNALTLAANGDNTIRLCLELVMNEFVKQVQALSSKSIYDSDAGIQDGVNRLLFLLKDFRVTSSAAAPEISETNCRWEDCSEGAYLLYQTNCTKTIYNNYLDLLQASGYKAHETSVKEGNVWSATYYNDIEMLNITWAEGSATNRDNTMRVIVDPIGETDILTNTGESMTGRTDVQPLFIQVGGMKGLYMEQNNSMCYIVRLNDGTFIVNDAGCNTEIAAQTVLDVLTTNNVLEGAPIIACWIFSHGHGDHTGGFYYFSPWFASGVVVLKSVIYSYPNDAHTINCISEVDESGTASEGTLRLHRTFRERCKKYNPDVKIYKARTGMRYYFSGCTIEMLFIHEDYPKPSKLMTYYNDSSLVYRITLQDGNISQTFMMLGDASPDSNNILAARYGSYLKSNAVQVAHHGYTGGTNTVYDTIKAPVVFWPQGQQYPKSSFSSVTRRMLKQSYAKVCYVGYHGTVALTVKQVKAGSDSGTVYYTGRTAANAALGK